MSEIASDSSQGGDGRVSIDTPAVTDVQRQVERILASAGLKRANRLADFLAYIVEETLEGRQDRIKAYSIGIEVFGRDTAFDPQLDPVVRIEAGRLRRELEYYYLATGRDDPIGVEIPKGGYVPRFFYRAQVARRTESELAPAHGEPAAELSPAGMDWRRWRWIATGAVIACLFALVWAGTRIERAASDVAAGESAQPAILLLPFADLGGGQDIGLRAVAISDELKARLVRFREVTVIAPERPGTPDPAKWPAARYLLDGSVRADDSRVRITARLIDRTSGRILWSDVYDLDPKASDVIALEQDIASRVATAVAQPYGVLFRSAEFARDDRPPAELSDGYQCALKFYEYRKALSAELHAGVRTCLQRSIAATPGNATAWAMLSYAYLDEDRFGYHATPGRPPVERALRAAQRAIQLDPANVRALQAMMTALFFNRQPQEALQYGEQAYRLNPDDTELLGEYGSRLMQAGDHARGMAMMQEALTRNPGATDLYSGLLALGAYLEGDDARALTLIRRADLQNFPIYHFVATLIFARNGLAQDAASSRETFLKMRPAFFTQFDAELDKRNFNAADRAKIAADAATAGFPVAPPRDLRAY
ncbi:hypothetical protein [Bosea sp. 117]|uniref:hypothetical protein n=1 Tax=Bosea sp. 117 TaxID=1125973 RepID=UPI000570C406|nr:hypothetical protein [Bosea sp. 117]